MEDAEKAFSEAKSALSRVRELLRGEQNRRMQAGDGPSEALAEAVARLYEAEAMIYRHFREAEEAAAGAGALLVFPGAPCPACHAPPGVFCKKPDCAALALAGAGRS